MDKNKAMINYLLQCPAIRDNSLFFNFADKSNYDPAQVEYGTNEDNSLSLVNHFINEKDITQKAYIDGSKLKQYTFTIASYIPISHIEVNSEEIDNDQNIEYMSEVQKILDWIMEQADIHNFPDFGPNCVVDEILTATTDPDIDGIDTSVNPPIARYSVMVKLSYLDTSKRVFK